MRERRRTQTTNDLAQRRHAPNCGEDLSGLIGEEQTGAQLLARHTDGAHLQEAPGGFEPPIRVLQTRALPLGYGARSPKRPAVYHAAHRAGRGLGQAHHSGIRTSERSIIGVG